MRAGLLSASVLFLALHLVSLPPTFEDLDSLNFALGVRHFDVAAHQPHPPGYPVFIVLGKIATAAMRWAGVAAPDVRGLAIWSATAGAVLIPLSVWLWSAAGASRRHALLAAALMAAAPLFWFTALRPLSDMIGLAVSVAALAALVESWPAPDRTDTAVRSRWLLAGALVAGFAIGLRSQTAALTGPLLALAVLLPASRIPVGVRAAAVVAFSLGVTLWGIPLIVASGGPSAYLAALGSQAGEDFSGVVMLWTHRTARVAVDAIVNTAVRPWDSSLLAGVVLGLAAGGKVVLVARRRWRELWLVTAMFGPYVIFHLLFHESITTRYALPVVLPIAYLAAVVLDAARPAAALAGTGILVIASLALAVPAGIGFGRQPSPIFAALRATMMDPLPVIAMHRRIFTESRRARAWLAPGAERTLPAPRDFEWREVSQALRNGAAGAWFLADPHRTDLALIDPASRTVVHERWPFHGAAYMGGARPDEIDLHRIVAPGWLLDEGWALTPETAGVAAREGWTLDRRPATAWVRRRSGPVSLMLGGRHIGSGPAVRLNVTVDGHPVTSLDVAPGTFLRFVSLPAGALDGPAGYASLEVRADPSSGRGSAPPVLLEQFDLQDPDRVQFGFDEGWQEAELNPRTSRGWRWMSDRASLQVRGGTGDVILRLSGESPRRYFAAAPDVTVTVAGQPLLTLRPDRDFTADVTIPASALAASGGRVALTSSEVFVPGDRDGSPDRRRLALRLYDVSVTSAAR